MRNCLGHGTLTWLAGCVLTFTACGDDQDDDVETAHDGGLDGGHSDGGGDGGAADAARSLDSGMDAARGPLDAGAVNAYQCLPPALPSGTIEKGAACCGGLGTCEELGDGGASSFGDCNARENLRCVAHPLSSDAGMVDGGARPVACRAKIDDGDAGPDYEGRCIPECLTRGASGLDQSTCGSGLLCVPCYNPVTGEDTGACHNGGDRPLESQPAGFSQCADGLGYCISTSLAGQDASLPQLSCSAGAVCAPKQRVLEPDSCFAHCTSIGALSGACVPAFIVPDMSRGVLPRDVCMMGELCSPCISPLDQKPTGACN